MSDSKELLQKLKRLAEQGVGGERANADAMLRRALKKHGLSAADLEQEDVREYEFRYKNKFERKLLGQTIYKVINEDKVRYRTYQNRRNHMLVKVTVRQAVEIEFLYDLYRSAFWKNVDDLLRAFVIRNEIWNESSGDKKQPTAEEIEEFRKAAKLADQLDPVQVHRRLSSGGAA